VALGAVEGDVGGLDEAGRGAREIRAARHADAGADSQPFAADVERLIEACIKCREVVVEPSRVADDGEFVAAEPSHQIIASGGLTQIPPNDLKHRVTRGMAE